MLEVRLIGKFEVRFNGEPVILSARAAQSLFAFVILSAGTQHRREKLAGVFWPDAPEGKARAYLRHELWRIRKAFSEKTDLEFLLSDDIAISFDANTEYWLDVDLLTRLDDQATERELEDAISLYQGELLPGFYDEWVLQEREHLRSIFDKRVEQLMQLLESKKQWNEILAWAEYWIASGGAPETAYQYLMLAFEALGDRVKVVSTYERCVRVLRELDLEPSELTRSYLSRRKRSLNIPIPLTSFIGRETELKDIARLLSKSRLVTLTGSGGVGKTRLAVHSVAELLDQFPDGIWFLDLAPLSDAALIPNTLAGLLGLQESGDQRLSITDILVNYFLTRTALVIFDNCEHLIDSCARLVHTLLTSCEHVFVLATSREPLRVLGEIPYRVPSLKVPQGDDDVTHFVENESVRLFVERAAVDLPDFKLTHQNALTIAQICIRLDGIPLAIELAAARVSILSVEQILERLDDRFNLLSGGLRTSLPRHQTLRATIEWSYDLLSEKERILFRRLAVFSGGWTLEAAEEACSWNEIKSNDVLDLLSQLVNKSLVLVENLLSEKRYYRLETIRQFARERLSETSETEQLRDRHLDYFLRKVEKIEPLLTISEQSLWMDYLDLELDNIRLALGWSFSHSRGNESLRLFGSLAWFCYIHCHCREGLEWFKQALKFRSNASKNAQAKAIGGAGWLNYAMDDLSAASSCHRESANLYRELDDQVGLSTQLQFAGVVEFARGNLNQARPLLEESLQISRRINNKLAMPRVLLHLGHFSSIERDFSTTWQDYEEALVLSRELGEGHLTMVVLEAMGGFWLIQKDNPPARKYFTEALEISIRLKNKRTIAEQFLNFAQILNTEQRYMESAQLQGFAESLFSESESLTGVHIAMIREIADTPKKHLGDESYTRELEFGRTLRLEMAVQIALKE